MITKLKKESIKRCLKHNRLSLIKFFQIYFIIFLFFIIKSINSDECKSTTPLKVGLIDNENINYQYYLYYELGNYAKNKNLEFEIQIVKNNANEYDLIFGEYYDLIKLTQNNINFPGKIKDFYLNNNLELSGNILPLDLDTFIIVSKSNKKKINTLEELSNFYDPIRYTLGMNFNSVNKFTELVGYNTNFDKFEINDIENESFLISLKKIYKNLNKNILSSDYLEIYNSYENDENVYTIFGDGVLLNKNFEYHDYQLFPQSKYKWNSDLGTFIERQKNTPISYYGFSVYVNNSNQVGFLCHLLESEVRKNSFKNFNISLSPLSDYEVKNFDNLPEGYLDLLSNKNVNISNINYESFSSNLELVKGIIFGNQNYQNIIETNDYLNRK